MVKPVAGEIVVIAFPRNDPAAEVRFEYGDENFFPSNYHVDSVIEETDALRVELRPPQTTCKARDRHAAGASCCC